MCKCTLKADGFSHPQQESCPSTHPSWGHLSSHPTLPLVHPNSWLPPQSQRPLGIPGSHGFSGPLKSI